MRQTKRSMNLSFYRRLPRSSKKAWPAGAYAALCVLLGGTLLAAGCTAGIRRVDDNKLAGVPAEKLEKVNEAKKELAMAKADVERAKDEAEVASYKLRIMKAALAVAEARAEKAGEEFALARFQNEDSAIISAGEKERAEQLAVRKSEFDVVVAQAKLEAARNRVAMLGAKVDWLDAKQEMERAKVALRYDGGTPNEKSAVLNEFERGILEAELAFKEAEGGYKRALVEVDAAERDRAALDSTK